MIKLHIDTDAGTDDALALLVASRLSGVEIIGVSTVFGNVPVATATRNVLLLRALEGRAWPVSVGADAAADGFRGGATRVHGKDGLGDYLAHMPPGLVEGLPDIAALPSLGEDVAAPDDRIVLLGLGPATNILPLVAAYGAGRIARIVLMTGVFFDAGNVTPFAEFNAWCDPAALADVVRLGVPVTLVPLDLTRKVQLARAVVEGWLEGAPEADATLRLVVGAHRHYMRIYAESEGIDGCVPHDLLAVLVACWPERFWCVAGRVDVVVDGERRGLTHLVADTEQRVRVVTGGRLKWIRAGLQRLIFT